MAAGQRGEITPGRRLRLDRRKVGLSQEELAQLLGTTQEEVSAMENNKLAPTPAAAAFMANPPTRVPEGPTPAPAPPPPAAEQPAPDAPKPGDGSRPPRQADTAPSAPKPGATIEPIDPGSIADLERALLVLFAGEAFLVPREQPDGTVIQVEAVIPGLAQGIGMYDEFDGMIVRTYAPGMARAWAQLARENATVRKVLFGLTYGGAWRGVAAATLPAILAIMAHHGALPIGRSSGGQVVDAVARDEGGEQYNPQYTAEQPLSPNGQVVDPDTGFVVTQFDPQPNHEPPPSYKVEP